MQVSTCYLLTKDKHPNRAHTHTNQCTLYEKTIGLLNEERYL